MPFSQQFLPLQSSHIPDTMSGGGMPQQRRTRPPPWLRIDMEEFAQGQSIINAGNGKETTNHRDRSASEKDEGDYVVLDGGAHQNINMLPGRHGPYSPPFTFVAPQAHCSNITSTAGGAANQIENVPVASDTAFAEAQELFLGEEFLSDELLTADLQDYNQNGILDSLISTFSPVAALVQNKSLDIGGRSVPGDNVNALPLKPAIMTRTSRFGWQGKRKVSDGSEVTESRIFKRKFLDKECSEAYPSDSPSSTILNSDNGEIETNSTFLGNITDEDGFRQCQGKHEVPHDLGEEILMKTMGWFPIEEDPNEASDTNLLLRWILDEPPSVSDLPRLESLMEISPSKFWSPKSELKKRSPVQFGYHNLSESPQTAHSIQYFLKDSPTSSPDVTRTILGGASGVRIPPKESNYLSSQACRNFHGSSQKISTPICFDRESMETSMKSLGSAQIQDVPEVSLALPTDNPKKDASRELKMTVPAHQNHTHHQETVSIANRTTSDTAAPRTELCQRGKNLVVDFMEVGTSQEYIQGRLMRNDTPHEDSTAKLMATSWTQIENSSNKMRLQCWTGFSTKGKETALRADGNWVASWASQGDQNWTRKADVPSVPLSYISNHSNVVTSLRNSLHEKLESQLLHPKPLSKSLRTERLVTIQSPESTPNKFPAPRVSRKRSIRITTPKLTRVDVLNMFGNGKVAESVRITPDKDYSSPDSSSKRRKATGKRMFVVQPTSQRNVVLQSTPASDCETDLRGTTTQGDTSLEKPPNLTRIIKPLWRIKTSPANAYCVRRKPALRSSVRKGLLTDSQNVNAKQFVKNAPGKHCDDVTKAIPMSGKNLGSSSTAIQRHEIREESLPTIPPDSEMSNIGTLRSSKYRGVTRHRHTGRYEAHLWDNTKVKLGQAKRGRQVYLGAYPNEDEAAQAHDLAALKYWGLEVYTNFPPCLYKEELKTMKNLTKEEYIVVLRRRSPGFTRGISKYRGVTRHHQEGRWEARIGRHSGAKYHYLGTYDTQEEAAAAYDRAAVRRRGVYAITNFDISNYINKISNAHKTVSPASSSSGES